MKFHFLTLFLILGLISCQSGGQTVNKADVQSKKENKYVNKKLVIQKVFAVTDLNKELGVRGFQISNGYGDLKEKTFRIAHMADCTVKDINELLDNINDILKLK